MKKLLFIITFFILTIGFNKAQQNGTFNHVYSNYLQPIYPSTSGLRIQNTIDRMRLFVNDTTLVNYIIYWSKKGGGVIDTSKLVTLYGVANGNYYTDFNWSSPNAFSSFGMNNAGFESMNRSPSGSFGYLSNNSTGSIVMSTMGNIFTNTNGLTLDTINLRYTNHQTSSNPLFIPDKFYVDSLVASGGGGLDSSKLVTKYGISNAMYNLNYYLQSPKGNTNLSLLDQSINLTAIGVLSGTGTSFNLDTVGAINITTTGTGGSNQYTFDNTGIYNVGGSTVQNMSWIPNKNYVDSLFATGGGGGFTNISDSSYKASSRLITTYTGTLSDSINGIDLPSAGTYEIIYNIAVTVGGSTTSAATNIDLTHIFKNTPMVSPNGSSSAFYLFPITALSIKSLHYFSGSFVTTVSGPARVIESVSFDVAPSLGGIYTSNHYISYIKLY